MVLVSDKALASFSHISSVELAVLTNKIALMASYEKEQLGICAW
jgi:hypothetical protein